jgi:hypothetical protein
LNRFISVKSGMSGVRGRYAGSMASVVLLVGCAGAPLREGNPDNVRLLARVAERYEIGPIAAFQVNDQSVAPVRQFGAAGVLIAAGMSSALGTSRQIKYVLTLSDGSKQFDVPADGGFAVGQCVLLTTDKENIGKTGLSAYQVRLEQSNECRH